VEAAAPEPSDGGRVGDLIDSAFLTVGNSVYCLELMASLDDHDKYGWMLDTLIATFDVPI
jgi:hypothetical protein